jgi:hypothetical protein
VATPDRSTATQRIALENAARDSSTTSARSCADQRGPHVSAQAGDESSDAKRQPRLHSPMLLRAFAATSLIVSERAVAQHSLAHQRVPERATPGPGAATTPLGLDRRRSDFDVTAVTKGLVAGLEETMRMAP